MNDPISTYRLQFSKDFTFADFSKMLAYLRELGVHTIYASPIFEATPGSMHGYDVTNPHRLNPEIGTASEWRSLRMRMNEMGMDWVQDIIPNHMAFHPQNGWLMDIFEKGDRSFFYYFFDIDWESPLYDGRLMAPFLGKPLEKALEEGELKLVMNTGKIFVQYYDNLYPISYRSYPAILQEASPAMPHRVRELLHRIQRLDEIYHPQEFETEWTSIKEELAGMDEQQGEERTYIEGCLHTIEENLEDFHQLLDEQDFALTYWKETEEQINYRRFFTINGLICLRMEDEEVFEHYHQFIKESLNNGMIQGLRIDHIDGLKDPSQYLQRLRRLAGKETYIVVEKILESEEKLPADWPVQGSTGYDFLADINNLLTRGQSEEAFEKMYQQLMEEKKDVEEQVYQKKKDILEKRMAGEKQNLLDLFQQLELAPESKIKKAGEEELKEAIGEFLIRCSVYRFYGNQMPLPEAEAKEVGAILKEIRQEEPSLKKAVNLLEKPLLKNGKADPDYRERALQFYMRCMQFTGPLMAKGVEDTLMYVHNRFVAHNEVGDSLESFGISAETFHKKMQERQEKWPLALNTTSTHDTKRGEDVRARLNVLSELPEEWRKQVQHWEKLNQPLKETIDGQVVPDENDEYLLYQTLLGVTPTSGETGDDFQERIEEYFVKALREAKVHTNWSEPNEDYEQGCVRFISQLLNPSSDFWAAFVSFLQKVAAFGKVNSLSQVMLKFLCPGVPDVYQGSELWNDSLVDPDNRRPVDYAMRKRLLREAAGWDPAQLFRELTKGDEGKAKLWLTKRMLEERKAYPELFSEGDYLPLEVKGKYRQHVFAFARKLREDWLVTAIPLYTAALSKASPAFFEDMDWEDTRIQLLKSAPVLWQNRMDKTVMTQKREIRLGEAFSTFPYLLLKGRASTTERGAGILAHITSLPSKYGIGDLGPASYRFADFLFAGRQKYWQVLPLNPVSGKGSYSPYSSNSGFAGNSLLLSIEGLVDMGLLDRKELKAVYFPESRSVDFLSVEAHRRELFAKVHQAFKKQQDEALESSYREFREKESFWLEDYCLYVFLKEKFEGAPWYEWPAPLRDREEEALSGVRREGAERIEQEQVLQFLFYRQWKRLKAYCHDREIQLIGDLPFYVSYDSADVWMHPEYFHLDEEKRMTAVAGVPPDYFNENGQLWGMPIYRWKVLKKEGYDWWIHRIKKNLDYFDLLRLDHFRAFSAYWEVPAGEETAINGKWVPGPGRQFFKALKKEMGELPVIAEDLGDISDDVYELRDRYELPGMTVLQFAFSDEMPRSVHTPHNFRRNCLVYTGTHDNNTTKGWYEEDLDWESRKRLNDYAGRPVSAANAASELTRMAYQSVADRVIIPVQDLMNLGPEARMNTPSTLVGNWKWKLTTADLEELDRTGLRQLVERYRRY